MSLSIEDRTYHDVRWQCRCGRFIAESAIHSYDEIDPHTYYGVATRSQFTCHHCGVLEGLPRCITVKSHVLPDWTLSQ